MTGDALGVEEAPVTLNAAELRILPRLVEVLEEEVTSAVVVCLTDESVKEYLSQTQPSHQHHT